MKIISFSALKGGVGKTTILYNFGEYLSKNNKILMIDSDHQCSLSSLYGFYDDEKYGYNMKTSFINIFEKNKKVAIHKIKKNLDVIYSSLNLDDIEGRLQTIDSKNYFLWDYIDNNYSDFEKYDYILIDCHPDFGIITKNAIAVSDYVVSLIEPSEFGFENRNIFPEKFNLWKNDRSNIDRRTKKTLIKAKMIFLANMIRHNTTSSNDLLNAIQDDDLVISIIPHKEIINKTTLLKKPLNEYDDETVEKLNLDFIFKEFDNLKAYIDKDNEDGEIL